ncbi:MAG: NADPH:quinone reductase, partial [Geminicoccaceae bacterium]
VWLYNAQRGRPFGTAAEHCVLSADNAVALPEAASFIEGACLGVPAQTAHFAVTADGEIEGQTVLVQGGAGAVGHYAVQWGKRFGAKVIATVSNEEKAVHARAAGADAVIDYRQDDVIAAVRAIVPDGVDRIIEVDLGANMAIDTELIREGGVIASYSSTRVPEPVLPYYPLAYKGVTLRLVQAYILPSEARARAIAGITGALIERTLIHSIATTFPLDDIASAHEVAESVGRVGKIVVTI